MKTVFLIAFRNLFRQKGRSILMGLGICISISYMIIGNSINKGMYANIVNNMVESNLLGHCSVNALEKNGSSIRKIIRDKDMMIKEIKSALPNVKDVEEVLTGNVFAIGNGRQGSSLTLTGISATSVDMIKNMDIVEGSFKHFIDDSVQGPLILEQKQAELLKVNVGDTVRVRLNTIYGQVQSTRLKVVATVKITNSFMLSIIQGAIPLSVLKELMGYKPHEAQTLNVVLENLNESGDIITFADILANKLTPKPAYINGIFISKHKEAQGVITGLKINDNSVKQLLNDFNVGKGDIEKITNKNNGVIINKVVANELDAKIGSSLTFSYQPKFSDDDINFKFTVAGIMDASNTNMPYLAFINQKEFYDMYLNELPVENGKHINSILTKDSPLFSAVSLSWKLAERTYSTYEYQKKQRDIRKSGFYGSIIDVSTLQEMADEVFNMEATQDMIIFFIMLIILSIILVGIINTTRMNIKERTREIGTIRAIGMQGKMVIRTLITESGFLCLFSIPVGSLAAYGIMALLSQIKIQTSDPNFAAILSNGHLVFKTPMSFVLINIFLIFILNLFAVWIPARKAVKLSIAEALGHDE